MIKVTKPSEVFYPFKDHFNKKTNQKKIKTQNKNTEQESSITKEHSNKRLIGYA